MLDTVLIRLDEEGIIPHLRIAIDREGTGVLRVRSRHCVGSVWFVRREIVHAVVVEGKLISEGIAALELMSRWNEGTVFTEPAALPPARTIRLLTEDILAALEGERPRRVRPAIPANVDPTFLRQVLERLRVRVPGLESIVVFRGENLETAASDSDAGDPVTLESDVRDFRRRMSARRLFVEHDDRAVLMERLHDVTTVLTAGPATAAESLLWASEELQRTVPALADRAGSERQNYE